MKAEIIVLALSPVIACLTYLAVASVVAMSYGFLWLLNGCKEQ